MDRGDGWGGVEVVLLSLLTRTFYRSARFQFSRGTLGRRGASRVHGSHRMLSSTVIKQLSARS